VYFVDLEYINGRNIVNLIKQVLNILHVPTQPDITQSWYNPDHVLIVTKKIIEHFICMKEIKNE